MEGVQACSACMCFQSLEVGSIRGGAAAASLARSWRAGGGGAGRRRHGARPHQSIDGDLDCGAGVVSGLQEAITSASDALFSRWWFSFGGSRGQGHFNVIADHVRLLGTVPSRTPPCTPSCRGWDRRHRPGHLPAATGGEAKGALPLHPPPVHNDPALTGLVKRPGRDAAWSRAGDPAGAALPGGGGFRRKLLRAAPGTIVSSGGAELQGCAPLHNGQAFIPMNARWRWGEGCSPSACCFGWDGRLRSLCRRIRPLLGLAAPLVDSCWR